MVEYTRWRNRPEGPVVAFPDARREEAAATIAAALEGGPRWLDFEEVARLLSCYGIALAAWRLAGTADEAGAVARALEGPVALKALVPGLLHKTEAGAVQLGLAGEDRVRTAARAMAERLAEQGYSVQRFLVQVHDRQFGPVVACGAGGTVVELLRDVQVRITPLTEMDAREMVRALATCPLLEGCRGAPRADVAALEELLLRVSAMVEAHPEVAEMDLNPVMVLPSGCTVVDVRVRVEVPEPLLPLGARRRDELAQYR
ncbi:MAG TPA: acetate--CoA ligase family protein [Actinomycetota bacterium]|nr:acetate--CoA ligase family protein [Actinomycetota bacterium]